VSERTVDENAFIVGNVSVRGGKTDPTRKPRGTFTATQQRLILDKARETRFGGDRHEEVMHLLMGMTYLGMAPNEMLLAQRGDVFVEPESGVRVIKVTSIGYGTNAVHAMKSTKNDESRPRTLPLHPKMEGFFEFATNGDPQEFIFDAFKWNMQKYRRGWFDANFVPVLLVKCGIAHKMPEGKVVALTADGRRTLSLYSVRHRFHRVLDNSNVSLKRQLVLTGHADPADHFKYDHGADLLALYRDIASLDPLADVLLTDKDA
jgi:hypothetical protein